MTRNSEHDAHKALEESRDHNAWGVPSPPKQPWSKTLTQAVIITALIVVGSVLGQWLIW